jgi:hypothetical protein
MYRSLLLFFTNSEAIWRSRPGIRIHEEPRRTKHPNTVSRRTPAPLGDQDLLDQGDQSEPFRAVFILSFLPLAQGASQ